MSARDRAHARRMLRGAYGVWPLIDHLAHRLHLAGPIGKYLCYRADLAFGATETEARS